MTFAYNWFESSEKNIENLSRTKLGGTIETWLYASFLSHEVWCCGFDLIDGFDERIQVYFIRALNWNCVIDVLKLIFSSHVWMRKTAFFPQQNKLNVFNQNKNSNFFFSQNERVLRNNHFSMKFFSLQKSKQPNRKCENMKIWITACEIGWKFYVVIRRIVAMSIIIIFAFVRISEKVKITASFFSRFVTFFFFGLLPTNSIWLIPKFHNVK